MIIRAWQYNSSQDEELTLLADIYPCDRPAPLCLAMHGWHGTRSDVEPMARLLSSRFLVVAPDMRGRGGSSGIPDANGFELIDAIDALEAVLAAYPNWVSDEPPRVWGGSGGGGNTYALVAKYPDLWGSAAVACGISDYAEWYRRDQVGEFIDEMKPWIGFSPYENGKAYDARSGLYLLPNVLTSLAIWHGDADPRVPVWHAQSYAQRAAGLDIACTYHELPGVGHGIEGPFLSQMVEYLGQPATPPTLPQVGELIVGGWLYTKAFRIVLNDPECVAKAYYRLNERGQCAKLGMAGKGDISAQVVVSEAAQVVASFPFERCSAK